MSIEKCKDFIKDGYGTWDDTSKPTTYANMYDYMKNQNNIVMNLASGIWQPSTSYAVGAIIRSPSLPAGCKATCTTAGATGSTEPTWTAYGTTVTDGTIKWKVETDVQGTMDGEREKAIDDMHSTITDEITEAVNALHDTIKSEMKTAMLALFPVGTIIETEVDVNPGTYIGGTWEKMPAGYVTISAGAYTETQDGKAVTYDFKAGNTYGEAAHKLTVGELPHIHGEVWNYAVQAEDMNVTTSGVFKARPNSKEGVGYAVNFITANDGFAIDFGEDKYSNNLPPSVSVYRFRRMA